MLKVVLSVYAVFFNTEARRHGEEEQRVKMASTNYTNSHELEGGEGEQMNR